jgi:tetratricopeptide (TPR) repeat protein
MPGKASSVLLAAIAALSLGGCKSVFTALGFHRPSIRAVDVSYQGGSELHVAGQLMKGRQALDDGNFAEAISAFSSIRGEPGYSGDAYNGMAIAYLNIGRPDLAETYFARSIAAAPGNEKFQRNLAMFRNSRPEGQSPATSLAQAAPGGSSMAVPATGRPATEGQSLIPGVRVENLATRIVRLSAGEVFLPSDLSVAFWEPSRPQATVRLALVHADHRPAAASTRPPQPRTVYPVRFQVRAANSKARR